jgi:hypothetical protein
MRSRALSTGDEVAITRFFCLDGFDFFDIVALPSYR